MASPTKLNSFTGIGYGQKATTTIQNGPTYEEIFIETNLSAAQLKRVVISLNADENHCIDGELMKQLEAYKGIPTADGFFSIPLADITAKTKHGMKYTGLVTQAGDNITLEIEIADTDQANPPAVKLAARATVSANQPARVVIPMIKKQIMQASGTENQFLDLVSGADIMVRRMHFLNDAINAIQVDRDYVRIYDTTKEFEMFRAKRNKRFWQANVFHFDPIMRGYYIDELFRTAHSSELKFTVFTDNAVGSIPIIVESVRVVRPDLV